MERLDSTLTRSLIAIVQDVKTLALFYSNVLLPKAFFGLN